MADLAIDHQPSTIGQSASENLRLRAIGRRYLMFGFHRYNYERFHKDEFMKDAARHLFGRGPETGDKAPDFEARTLEGDKVQLSDFRGEKNVVLTFGSSTCPFTAASIGGLNDLYEDFSGDD